MIKQIAQPSKLSQEAKTYIKQHIPHHEPVLSQKGEVIKVCWPDLSGNELKYVEDCVKTGWVSSMGKYVSLFEQRFAEYCGARYSVSVTNGTHAIHLALAALGIRAGDEVIIPTFTMIATANVVKYLGATPIFVDARPDTWNIDETKIEEAITSKTKAIIVVHIYGHPCEMNTIMEIAKKHKLWVIEDAAEAHGAMYHGHRIGAIGDIGCFSMYANKVITTGEGGIVVTNNPDLHRLMYKLHNHAFDDEIHFWHEYLGYNYRLTNLQAALGCAQVERIDELIGARRRNAQLYMKSLSYTQGIQFPVELPGIFNTYWMFGFVLTDEFPMTRDELRDFLADYGIETRTFFIPMHMQPIYFKKEYMRKFPVADRLCKNGLYLPSSSSLTTEKIEYICSKIMLAAQRQKK